jgi:hypothetical protein
MTPVIAAALLFASCGGSSDEQPADNLPALTPFGSPLASRLHQIRDKVSEIRGLPPYQVASEGTLTQEALRQYAADELAKDAEKKASRLDAFGVALKMMGLIDKDADLKKLVSEVSTDQILGLYFPDKDRLALVASEQDITMLDEYVLAHEYTHSLQDGTFDIEEFGKPWTDSDLEKNGYTEYETTLDCLLEGDATFTAGQYAEQVFGADWRDKISQQAKESGVDQTPKLPEFLQRQSGFNYGDCANFVEQLYKDGGWEAVNKAYANPPATTEQVLNFGKYKSHEVANTTAPKDLSEQMPGWESLDSGPFGEFDVYDYALTLTGDQGAAFAAAQGWGAGWANIYRDKSDPNRAVVQLFLGWDTDNDLLEFLVVYAAMLHALNADYQPVDQEGNVRWTATGQFGAISINKRLDHVDIRIATDADALKLATKDIKAFQ